LEEEDQAVVDDAEMMLRSIEWGSALDGFSVSSSIDTMATFLSNAWLTDEHMLLMLDRLKSKLETEMVDDCHLPDPLFLHWTMNAYEQCGTASYSSIDKGTVFKLRQIGNALTRKKWSTLAGVLCRENHWTAWVLNASSGSLHYGDSRGGAIPPNLKDAVCWWLQQHIPDASIDLKPLPIAPQNDSFSCGILAINAVMHALLPDHRLIGNKKSLSAFRVGVFVDILQQHEQMMVSEINAWEEKFAI
jgi:hypothetical protein